MGEPSATAPDEAPLEELLALARATAREAAGLVAGGRTGQVEVLATKSSPTDVVTRMDHAAEELIRRRLASARPQDVVHGEEAGSVHGVAAGAVAAADRLTWLVDPIDGTINYLYGIPAFAVSVAVVCGDADRPGRWRPLAGCVVDVPSGVTWTAAVGRGAFRDGVRLAAATPPPLERALVGTGFGYRPERRRAQARVLADLLPRIRDVRRIGSAALDLCAVADGRLDAFYERGLNAWDMAAGMLVLAEAGAGVLGLHGAPPGPDMVVAAAEPLLTELRTHLERLDASRDDDATQVGSGLPAGVPDDRVSPRPAG